MKSVILQRSIDITLVRSAWPMQLCAQFAYGGKWFLLSMVTTEAVYKIYFETVHIILAFLQPRKQVCYGPFKTEVKHSKLHMYK